MKHPITPFTLAVSLAGLLLLSGCIKISARDDATSLSQLGSDQILVVGKIEPHPPPGGG
ncbi:MAG: hypothetical protein MZV65_37505 [Chromatiales bacterium]|nr:hypothetical protein [Chromatiales bacterium]